jgi:CopG family nickel-responsive transcriptional regulator
MLFLSEKKENMRKKRFGVSLPENLVDDLDHLGRTLSIDRSKLVEEAVRLFIRDHRHHIHPHYCKGVLIIQSRTDSCLAVEVKKILEEFRSIIRFSVHFHVDDDCLDMIVTSGSSQDISRLHMRLRRLRDLSIRYIPLARLE